MWFGVEPILIYMQAFFFLLHNISQGLDPPLRSSSITGQGVTCRLLPLVGWGVPGIST